MACLPLLRCPSELPLLQLCHWRRVSLSRSQQDPPLAGIWHKLGVRIPFRKDGHDTRWGIEAQMGLGVGFMKTDKFINKINGQRVDIYNESYFGFDNLALSLYYELDNRKKNHYK